MVWWLICVFFLPTPIAGIASARGDDDETAVVRARLTSPKRAQSTVARADAAAQAARVRAETQGGVKALPVTLSPITAGSEATRQPMPLPSSTPAGRDKNALIAASPERAAPRNDGRGDMPKSLGEVLFNHTASFLGVPGLAPQQGTDGNYDEGLGFHQDGTVRKAGAGSASGSAAFDGRRAASYAGHGLGYGPGSAYGGYGYNGMHEPGYDPVTGWNWRVGDPTAGGRISGNSMYGRSFDNMDPARAAMDRGLNYGLGIANSAAEAALSGLVDGGRARLNFGVDWNGRINGEGDVLYPFYDSQYTTIYTQLGARTMSGMDSGDSRDGSGADRWIGNLGMGQRWFPQAQSLTDSGNWMFGYNAFFDYDFTRSHQRGGIGIETQYDWLRVASNYYFPISSWRDSKDFDGDFVKERAAEGWDLRVKGYLPFYRNVAVTGAYSQWYGDHVGMFSTAKLEKDPKVWSYGLEYTPVPLVSGFVNQRSTEQGRSDTEFGLRLTYHFQMPWEDQISHSKVAELRTVSGSRHEFVDRENRIILEYKAKNSFYIESHGLQGNDFIFRIRNGFNEYIAGQQVRVTAGGGVTLAEASVAEPQTLFAKAVNFLDALISVKAAYAASLAGTYVSDRDGYLRVPLTASSIVPGATLTVQAGDATQTFPVSGGAALYSYDLSALAVDAAGNLSGTITVQNADTSPASGVAVTLAYRTHGGLGTATSTDISLSNTNASGQVAVTGNVTALERAIAFSADGYATSVQRTVGTIPTANTGTFLTGASVSTMNFAAAQAYCASHGGRLPLVNGQSTYAYLSYNNGESVDGFGGVYSATFPPALGSDVFWTATTVTTVVGDGGPAGANKWTVSDTGVFGSNGKVDIMTTLEAIPTFAICLP